MKPSQLAIAAAKARAYFDGQAKERQKVRKGNQAGASVVSVPQLDTGKSRDIAGKADDLYESEREKAKEREKARKGKQAGASKETVPDLQSGQTRDKIGKQFGISGPMVDRGRKVVEAAKAGGKGAKPCGNSITGF